MSDAQIRLLESIQMAAVAELRAKRTTKKIKATAAGRYCYVATGKVEDVSK